MKLEIDEDDCEIGDHEQDRNYAVKNCEVIVPKLRLFHEESNRTDKTYGKEKLLKSHTAGSNEITLKDP